MTHLILLFFCIVFYYTRFKSLFKVKNGGKEVGKLRLLGLANHVTDNSKSNVIKIGHRLNDDSADSDDEIGFRLELNFE